MNSDISAKRTAYSLLKKNKIGIPTLDDIVFIIKSFGFDIIDYDLDKGQSSTDTLIKELGLQSLALTGKAFIYQKEDIKLLFICDLLSADEKKYACAHELGHIAYGHLKNGVCNNVDMTEECEANEFAHYLLHPGKSFETTQWIRNHKFVSWAIIIILATSFILIATLYWVSFQKSYYGEYYVTESGTKYHEKECIYIRNNESRRRLTIDEYETGEYEPCKICLPKKSGN